ncbi:hypothetical protein A2U01_0000856, partial [Trifolium medium]|nr:hypothetical protein [Trifolium medium]
INCRYDKLHADVRPYAMMSRTCYMQYDPTSDRGLIPEIYARCISTVIGNTVYLKDVNLNEIQDVVERNKSEMYFSHGWSRLRDFYNIDGGAWLVLLYISPFVFNLKIRNMDGIEITYPLNNPPAKLTLDKHLLRGSWDASISLFDFPKVYTHSLEKTLTAADVSTGSLTISWRGFCQNALPKEGTQLTLIDWLGNKWSGCHFEFVNNPNMSCKISGEWMDICKVHRLAEGVIVKFGVTNASDNTTIYFKLSPLIGVRTTLYAPSTSGKRKIFYQSQNHFML